MTEDEREKEAAKTEALIRLADAVFNKQCEDAEEDLRRKLRDAQAEHKKAVDALRDAFDRKVREW